MCGIAGLWAPRMAPEQRAALTLRMIQHLRHRGPDGTAHWDGDGVTLAIARLAIVDPRTPARVLRNESGRVHAVVNGEVYNHRSLRRALRARGHTLEPGLDTEVALHLYEQYGAARFAAEMDGMFAAAIWDAELRRLTLVRD